MERKPYPTYALGLLTFVITCPTSYAGTMGEKPLFPNGWMLIAGAGETGFMNVGSYNTATSAMTNNSNARGFQYGFTGDLAAGYGLRVGKPLFFAGEIGVNFFGNRKTSSDSAATSTTTTPDSTFIPAQTFAVNNALSTHTTVAGNFVVPYIDIKPGLLVLPNTWIYGRLGVNYNQVKVQTLSDYHSTSAVVEGIPITQPTSVYSTLNSKEKKQLAGLRTGLGFEYLASENVGISANYVYAFYSTFNTAASGSSSQMACDVFEGCAINSNGAYLTSGSSKMSDQQVLLELIYHVT